MEIIRYKTPVAKYAQAVSNHIECTCPKQINSVGGNEL